MKYELSTLTSSRNSVFSAVRKFWPLLKNQRLLLIGATVAVLINSATNLLAPLLIGYTVDTFITTGQFRGVLQSGLVLLVIYILGAVATYYQTSLMGTIGQRLLFTLRSEIFTKLQTLPLAFFHQNKAGDLISRINNDTDKLNHFFSQSLVQFVGNTFLMFGAAVFLITLNVRLGIAALIPAFILLIITRVLSAWIKQKNAQNLHTVGDMSAEISESLENFKLIAVFNRRDYLRERFSEVNEKNYKSAVAAGVANNTLAPIYGLASHLAQGIVLFYGIYVSLHGDLTIGLLVSYVSYVNRFYDPIRQVATIWSTFQVALAGWDRIAEILKLQSDMKMIPPPKNVKKSSALLEFKNVSFAYTQEKKVLHDVSFSLESGKTYAFVGPTGGGKTTIASLMARLFDPTKGKVLLHGRDIRSFKEKERTEKIGFILQEPFLFSGTISENILYSNKHYQNTTPEELKIILDEFGLGKLLKRFPQGLETAIGAKGQTLSLGQQQLIAFMRAVLRKPDLLILDEATANVDTVTEKLLDEILAKLSQKTTWVIIAHRFNTIENADAIFFVNGGVVKKAGSLQHAMDLLLKEKRST